MDIQAVNFHEAERSVENFISALQELKKMMQTLNDLPITRLKGVDTQIIEPMRKLAAQLGETGAAMVSQIKANNFALEKAAEQTGAALVKGTTKGIQGSSVELRRSLKAHFDTYRGIVSDESKALAAHAEKINNAALYLGINPNSIAAATQQAKQAMKGHYDALGRYVAEGAKDLAVFATKAQADAFKAADPALYLGINSSSVARATQQAKQAMKGHYDALGVYVPPAAAPVVDAAAAAMKRALMLDTGVVRQATQQAKQAMKGHYDALGRYVAEGAKELAVFATKAQADAFKSVKLDPALYLGINSNSIAAATQQAKQAMKGHYDALGRYVSEAQKELVSKAAASQQAVITNSARAQVNNAMLTPAGIYSSLGSGASFGTVVDPSKTPKAIREAGAAAAATGAQVKTLTDAFRFHTNVSNEMHSAYRGLASGFGALWLTWGSALPLLAGAAVSNAITQSVRKGAEVGQTLASIQYLGDTAASEMTQVNAAILELGRSGSRGPRELAGAFETLTLAGLRAHEQLAAIRDVLKFATVGQVEAKQSAETLTAVATAYGYSAKAYGTVGDIISKTAAISMASVTDMMEAFKTSSVVAQEFGVSLQDTAVGLALLANIGIRGQAAGTAYRNMVTELLGSSKQARKAIQDVLKVDIFKGDALKPIGQIMREIAGALSDKNMEGNLRLLTQVFNERGMKGSAGYFAGIAAEAKVAAGGVESVRTNLAAFEKEVKNAPGYMAMAAMGMALSVQNQFKGLGASLETAMVTAFQSVEPEVAVLAVRIREILNAPGTTDALKDALTVAADLVKMLVDQKDNLATAAGLWVVYQTAVITATVVSSALAGGLAALTAAKALLTRGRVVDTAATAANTVAQAAAATAVTATGNAAVAAAAKIRIASMAMGAVSAALAALGAAYFLFYREKDDSARQSADTAKALASQTIGALDNEIAHLEKVKAEYDKVPDMKKAEATAVEQAAVVRIRASATAELALMQETRAQQELTAAVLETAAAKGNPNAPAQLERHLRSMESYSRKMVRVLENGELEVQRFQARAATLRELSTWKAEKDEEERQNSVKRKFGKLGFDPDDNGGRTTKAEKLKIQHADELKQVEKRYSDQVSTINAALANETTLLKAHHDAKLINSGEFYARELSLAASAESRLLAEAADAGAKYQTILAQRATAAHEEYQKNLAINKAKKLSAQELDAANEASADAFTTEMAKVGAEAETFFQMLNNNKKTIEDSALTRVTLQAIKARGELKALDDASREFYLNEALARQKADSAAGTEDSLRYASPEQAAVIQAVSAAEERFIDLQAQKSAAIEVAREALNGYTNEMYNTLETAEFLAMSEVEQAELTAKQAEGERDRIEVLKRLRKELEALGALQATSGAEAGGRALTKFKKDEEAQLIKGVASAIEAGLFEGGQAGKKKLRDLIVAKLREPISLVINAVINPIMGALMGSLGLGVGTAAAGQAGAGSFGGVLQSANALGNLYSTLNTGVGAAVSTAFNKFALSGVGERLGLSSASNYAPGLTGAGSSLSTAAGYAGNAIAGYGLYKGISGGYSINSGLDKVGAVASLFGPVYGAIGGAINRAFGRKLKDQGLQGEFGGASGFSGENYQFYKGGWFRSDKTKTSALDEGTRSGLAWEFNNIRTQTTQLAESLGGSAASVQGYTKSIKVSFNGLTEAQVAEKLQEQFTSITDEMAQLALGTTAYTRVGERSSEALLRLSTSLTTFNAVAADLGWSLEATSLAGGAAASRFMDLFGGIDAFNAIAGSYYQHYYTDAERLAKGTEKVTAEFTKLGKAAPSTLEGFRAMVEAAERAGDDKLLAGLLKLEGAFFSIKEKAAEERKTLEEQLNALKPVAEQRKLELAKLDAGNRALQERVWALEAEKEASEAAKQAAEQAAQALAAAARSMSETARAGALTLRTSLGGGYASALEGNAARADDQARRLDALIRALETRDMGAEELKAYDTTKLLESQTKAVDTLSGLLTEFVHSLRDAVVGVRDSVKESRLAVSPLRLDTASGLSDEIKREDPFWEGAKLRAAGDEYARSQADVSSRTRFRDSAVTYLADWRSAETGAVDGLGKAQTYVDQAKEIAKHRDSYVVQQALFRQAASLNNQFSAEFETKADVYLKAIQDIDYHLKNSAEVYSSWSTWHAETVKGVAGAAGALKTSEKNLQAAVAYRDQMGQEYDKALRAFVTEASESVKRLDTLRERVVAYYEAQERLSELMLNSADKVREAVGAYRFSRLSEVAQYKQRGEEFEKTYSLALSTVGEDKAKYADRLADQLTGMIDLAKATGDYGSIEAYIKKAETVAGQLEATAPRDYQKEANQLLDEIDATLVEIGKHAQTAEKVISDAIYETGEQNIAGLRAIVRQLGGIPAFANGGSYGGGLALVGERGPELINFDQPGQVYTAWQTRAIMSGGRDDDEVAAEVRALRATVEALMAQQARETQAIVNTNAQVQRQAAEKTAAAVTKAVDRAAWERDNKPVLL